MRKKSCAFSAKVSKNIFYFTISGILENSLKVNWVIELRIHGPKIMIDPRIAAIFGINVKVCSCIDVVAWSMLIISPTPSPMMSIGAAIIKICSTPLRTI
jgi:hypothetical protein